MRINDLYNCECDDCKNDLKPNYIQLGNDKPSLDSIINAGFEALKHLHAQGSYNYKDLDQEPYKNLINKTNDFLSKAVTDNNVTDFMRDAFKNDIFIFSHLRTHAQLQEAGSLLLTDDGKIKSFDRLKLDIAKINGLYNENYLQAEYQFAISSVQMGEKWQNYVESNRYNLQYRTAQDDKVRISHQPLHGITLPMNNPFWDKFYPPNGWRCRCNAVQVRASKYPATNEENALKAGNIATTQIGKDNKNRLEIFRFNSGKQRLVFPPNHPYNKVKNADKVKDNVDYEILKKADFFNKKLDVLSKQMKEAYPFIDIEKINSINIYSSHFYQEINKFNRGLLKSFDSKNGITKKWYEALTRQINSGLDEIPNKYKGLVFRGTSLDQKQLEPYINAFKNGSVHIEKAFLSTSYSENKAFGGNVFFEITSKKGTMIEKLSDFESEKEVLFKAGQKFKVTDVIDKGSGNYFIKMEEI